MHKQVSVHIPQTVNFCLNSPESPFLEFQTRKPPPPNGKLQIWDGQSLLRNTPQMENFRFEMTKVYSGIPPPPQKWKTSDLRWPKFTPESPPKWKTSDLRDNQSLLRNTPPPEMKNFRFEMTKVYSRIPLQNGKPDLRWPKFTLEYPPKMKTIRFEITKVYSGIPPLRRLAILEIVCGD